jgi:hypothetical protein
MTSLMVAIQICMTLLVTSGITYLMIQNVVVEDAKNITRYQRFVAILLLIHAVLGPIALINLIWSY